jgi:hypothetical protein
LEFAPNSHVINYSTPRVCHVTSKDFKFAAEVDLDRKILNNKTVFGRRPVHVLVLCISFCCSLCSFLFHTCSYVPLYTMFCCCSSSKSLIPPMEVKLTHFLKQQEWKHLLNKWMPISLRRSMIGSFSPVQRTLRFALMLQLFFFAICTQNFAIIDKFYCFHC